MATVALLIGREPESRYSFHRGYADAVWAAGGTPIMLTAPTTPSDVPEYVRAVMACGAVCLTGGGDVEPARYGAAPGPDIRDADPFRDAAEIEAVRAAAAVGRRTFGICRGLQVLAAAFGGSLHQDLPSAGHQGHWDEARQYEESHAVTTTGGSLAEMSLGGAAAVNSIHHQAVHEPGPVLRVSACSPDGVIEALEAPNILGVQWHPERLWARDQRHLAAFRWMVDGGAQTTPASV